MLNGRDQTLFDRLGSFAGTFDSVAATAVASDHDISGWDIRDGLALLVRRSMLNAEHGRSGVTRYSMLESLRQYARERLDASDDGDVSLSRYASYYARVAEEIGPALLGPDELVARQRCHAELDNLRSAFAWALDRDAAEEADPAVRIAAALAMESHLCVASGIGSWAFRAVERAEQAAPHLRHATLGAAAQFATACNGDLELAEQLARSAIRDGVPSDSRYVTLAHGVLAIVRASLGSYDEALSIMTDSLEVARLAADPRFYESSAFSTRGMMLVSLGRHDEASSDAENALRMGRALRNPSNIALAQFVRGWIDL